MIRRPVIALFGAIIFLFGLVWFLQGIGIIPGSIMTGSQFWATAGAVMLIIGVVVIAASFLSQTGGGKAES